MSGYQVVVDASVDQITIETDDGKLTFSGRHSVTALARDIDKAIECLFQPTPTDKGATPMSGIQIDQIRRMEGAL